MPRISRSVCDVHTDACQCYKQANPVAQSLEELDFLKSACAAAQQGNVKKLQAILERHPEAVRSDYSSGAEVNAQTGSGRATPLHRAAYMGHADVVKLLTQHGANIGLQDSDGQTALHKAAIQGHVDVYQYLLTMSPAATSIRSNRGEIAADMMQAHISER